MVVLQKGQKKRQYYLYNKEVKESFLTIYDSDNSRKQIEEVLAKIGMREKSLKKDLYDFTYEELKDLIIWYNCKTGKALSTVKSIIVKYLKWARSEEQGFITDDLDKTSMLIDIDISQSVNQIALANQYIRNTKELLNLCENFCYNKQDGICFLLPYISAKGNQLEEIRNLRVDDCDFEHNKITLRNNEGIVTRILNNVSIKIMRYIQATIDEDSYYKNNGMIDTGVTVDEYKVYPTEYVVRYTGKRNSGDKIDAQVVNKRIEKIARQYGKPYITPTSLLKSGQMEYLRMIENKKGTLENDDYRHSQERFGLHPDRYYDIKKLYTQLRDKL